VCSSDLTPVIISRQSGVSEIVHHALKVDFWDTDEMANKIISIVRHPELRHTLSHNGQREVGAFTWEASAKKIKRVINKTLEWLDSPPPRHAH
jgi:glycosyltransferase involved in cell wall biosynthesis